jgi:transcription-repair coupling factor (superfamily II helicase)
MAVAADLTEVARQQLAALREFSEHGSGEKIALRDLELRGAGNLLGMEQSRKVAGGVLHASTSLTGQPAGTS